MRAAAARRYPERGARRHSTRTSASCTATELLADSSDGEDAMCDRFEAWVREHYAMPTVAGDAAQRSTGPSAVS